MFNLWQVEAALIAEPESEELLKLRDDLNEIIQLQQELIGHSGAGLDGAALSGSSAMPKSERLVWKVF